MRVQIDIDDASRLMIDELKLHTGLSQWRDLFNEAITLLNWAVRQVTQGRTVASLDEQEKNYRELQMHSLEHAKAFAAAAAKEFAAGAG